MSFDPSNIQAIGIGVTAFLATLVATFVIISSKKNKVGRALIIMLLTVVWWAWFGFLYHIFDYIPVARAIRLLSVLGITAISVSFITFASVYLEEKKALKKRERVILISLQAVGALLAIFLFADIFIQEGYIVGALDFAPKEALAPNAGPLLLILIGHFVFCILFGGYLLALRAGLETDIRRRREAIIILLSTTGGLILGGTRFAPWYGVDFAPFLGGLAVPLFTVGIFYIMAVYGAFNVRLVTAEFLIFSIWTFMFFRTLMNSDFVSAIPDIIVLVVIIVTGIFLIRSVLKEVESRVEVERVLKELASLNLGLERRVSERTKEFLRAGEHVKTIVENLPIGLIEVSNGKVLRRANRVASNLLNFNRDTKLGVVLTSKEGALWTVVERALGHNINYQAMDILIERPEHRDLEVITAPLVAEQGEPGFIILIRDVTQEKELNRAKNEFLTIAAHKLRTPITALSWALFTLSEGRVGELTKKQKEIVAETGKRAEIITDLINGFLLAAEMSSRKFMVRREMGDVGELLSKAVEQTRLLYDKNINCIVSIADDIPKIAIDPGKLSLAFKNILSNSFIYTPSGGTISVSAERKGSKILIQVGDTGIGISKNEEDILFQKFSRGREAARIYTEGSGLGLFITKQIIEAHSGRIFITSKKGKGTTVTVELPE
ncbi:MAG: hypothetical protein COU46_00555 [Candidatus Niyogibacteria bacterium CG10_big_fil_rev_8_21_14_0_10_42_19]|uniref:histidine kinase n=1 Tax=Candidatus Niyogibacteria bacterium CG10_big_fil_rev_8_21_14_0_10_42_19 TaxID=1974725 RepID=A0A2H0TGC8_9BACT|nr:MAG: hypothetical protein COU46_00555 [Candidatus Niyogibacteria bacterium CG10_big_fil_rev_8_21_14_0_10_42_19]